MEILQRPYIHILNEHFGTAPTCTEHTYIYTYTPIFSLYTTQPQILYLTLFIFFFIVLGVPGLPPRDSFVYLFLTDTDKIVSQRLKLSPSWSSIVITEIKSAATTV